LFAAGAHFTFEQNEHAIGLRTFANDDVAYGSTVFAALGHKPE